MRGKHTIIINGQQYDAITGAPVGKSSPQPAHTISDVAASTGSYERSAAAHHATVAPQRSKTLRRDAVKRPVSPREVSHARPAKKHVNVERSPLVKRFADHPRPITQPVRDIDISSAATAARPKAQPSAPSNTDRKNSLVKASLAAATPAKPHEQHKPARRTTSRSRVTSMVSASLALVVLAGYLTYLNMPNLSVRVAASQAGIAATFPEYHPDGYRFDGPIAFSGGEVDIKYASNTGKQSYTVSQKASTWDSQAVLDNYVAKASGGRYITSSTQGLTVYTFDGHGAWVNGGVLYTVSGNAPLSNEQILRIASSM